MAAQSWPASATTNTETPDYLPHNFADQMTDFNMIDSIDWVRLGDHIPHIMHINSFCRAFSIIRSKILAASKTSI
jgi:hypothetical protein